MLALPKTWETAQERDVLMAILDVRTKVWVILNKPLSTTINILALPKNWETGQERVLPVGILAMLTGVWVILNKP